MQGTRVRASATSWAAAAVAAALATTGLLTAPAAATPPPAQPPAAAAADAITPTATGQALGMPQGNPPRESTRPPQANTSPMQAAWPRAAAAALTRTTITGWSTANAKVQLGGQVRADITISPPAQRTVTLQYRRKGATAWTSTPPVTTTPTGQATVRYSPTANGTWQVRLQVPATASAAMTATAIRTVTCSGTAAQTTVSGWTQEPVTFTAGQTASWPITVSGGGGRPIQVEARAPGATSYTVVQSGTTSPSGKFTVDFTSTTIGKWALRLSVEASASARALTSPLRTVNVQAGKKAPVTELCGLIEADTTWLPATKTVYHLTCEANIAPGVEVKVAPGAVIKADAGAHIYVQGSLVVSGTEASPVILTSWKDDAFGGDSNGDGSATTPTAGDWSGIQVMLGSLSMRWARVRFAGESDASRFGAATLAVDVLEGSMSVSDSVFEEFRCHALEGAGISPAPRLERNVFDGKPCLTGEGSVATVTSAELDPGLLGDNTAAADSPRGLTLHGVFAASGVLDSSPSFPVGLGTGGYGSSSGQGRDRRAANTPISGTDLLIPQGVSLTIPAGSVVKGRAGGHLIVEGSLTVAGARESPVTLTSSRDDAVGGDFNGDGATTAPSPGDWLGIRAEPGASVTMTWARVRYAGDTDPNPGYGPVAAVDATRATVHMTDTEFASGGCWALRATRMMASPVVKRNSFADRARGCTGEQEPFAMLESAQLDLNAIGANSGLELNGTVSVSGAFDSQAATPVIIGDRDRLLFDGTSNHVDLTIPVGVEVTVPAGSVVKFRDNAYVSGPGALTTLGTRTSPVVFTSWKDDAYGGDSNGDGNATAPEPWSSFGWSVDGGSLALAWTKIRSGSIDSVGGSVSVTDSSIEGCGVTIKAIDTKPRPRIQRNAVTAPPSCPPWMDTGVRVNSDALDLELISGNNQVGVSGTLSVSGSINSPASAPITIHNSPGQSWSVGYGLIVPVGVKLTVPGGSVLKFDVASGLTVRGALVAQGTAAAPVVFTSLKDDDSGGDANRDAAATTPAASDWTGITVADGGSSSLAQTHLRYADIALNVWQATAVVSGTIETSRIGVRSDGSLVDARDVDWGSTAGPGLDDIVGSGIIFVPWVGYKPPTHPVPDTPQPVPTDNAANCKPYVAFGLRGSGEPPQGEWNLLTGRAPQSYGDDPKAGYGAMNGRLYDYLDTFTAAKMKQVAIQYEALDVPPRNFVTHFEFTDSIFDGVDKLIARMNQEITPGECPDAKFVLIGYSQGALVAHVALRILAKTDPQLLHRVAGVALIADPARVPDAQEEWLRTASYSDIDKTVTKYAPSLLQRLLPGMWSDAFSLTDALSLTALGGPLPTEVIPRTIAICHEWDPVCMFSVSPNMFIWAAHENYSNDELRAIAFLLSQRMS